MKGYLSYMKNVKKITFEPFLATDYNSSDFEADIDPNNNFYNNTNSHCKLGMG